MADQDHNGQRFITLAADLLDLYALHLARVLLLPADPLYWRERVRVLVEAMGELEEARHG